MLQVLLIWYGLILKQQMQWGQVWQPWYAVLLRQAGLSQAPHRKRCGWRVCRDAQLVQVGPCSADTKPLRRHADALQGVLQVVGVQGCSSCRPQVHCCCHTLPQDLLVMKKLTRAAGCFALLVCSAARLGHTAHETPTILYGVRCWCCLPDARPLACRRPQASWSWQPYHTISAVFALHEMNGWATKPCSLRTCMCCGCQVCCSPSQERCLCQPGLGKQPLQDEG